MVLVEVPLGEVIGPYVFGVVLVFLLTVIIWSLIRIRRRSRQHPNIAKGTTWTRPEDYADHHRVVWSADPSTFTPSSQHWPLAVAAVFGICSGQPWDELRFRNLDDARSGLEEAWGIRSRPQLLSRLHWILREGHRVDFAYEIEEWIALDEMAAKRLRAELGRPRSDEERERLWRFQQVRDNARGIRDVRFEAWDLVRAAMLTRAGYSLGWLSDAEATDTLNLISAQLQHAYSGWEELGEHFLRARWYWGSNSGLESRQEDAHDASRQAALLDRQRGPWAYVPWASPVPDSRALIVDAMVDEELLVEAPDWSPTPLAEMIDEITIERLAGRR